MPAAWEADAGAPERAVPQVTTAHGWCSARNWARTGTAAR